MMEFFSSLYQYNDWANQRVLLTLQKEKIDDNKILTLYNHILAAQNIWMSRIVNQPADNKDLWRAIPLLDLIEKSQKSAEAWISFLDEYPMDNFEEVIAYQNTKGIDFESKLSDILIHVANHGTHHRAQIVALLREKGIDPPQLDYIFFKRDGI